MIRLEELTWKEAEQALPAADLVVLPLGARLKAHGLHLPLNNDWLMAEELTRRVLSRCSLNIVLLPTLQHHHYPGLVEYPGSINLSRETSRKLVVDICLSLVPFGARRFFILNTGISTIRALEPARQELAEQGVLMVYSNYEEALEDAEIEREQPGGTHADEEETSIMMALAPEVVQAEKALPDFSGRRGSGLTRDPENRASVYSPTGAWGDPTKATREKGEVLVEAAVTHLVAQLEATAGLPLPS